MEKNHHMKEERHMREDLQTGEGMEDHHMEEEHHGIHMKDHSMDIHTGMEVNGGGASDVGALMISFSGRRNNDSIFVGRSIHGRSWGYEE